MTSQLEQIAEYYDQTQRLYKAFWHRDKSYAIHYGYWDIKTKNHQEALLNQNRFMADALKIHPGAKILDAGCGIGGSALWLAKNFDVHVIGITLSRGQLEEARKLANNHKLQERVEFGAQDYLHTNFAKNSFDIVWGLESVCHAKRKKEFLTEAYRVLKPGGKIVVADGFLKRDVKDSEEEIYKDFIDGFVLPNIAKVDDFKKWMKEADFKNVKFWDNTEEAKPSSRIMYRRTLLFYPLAKAFHRFGLISDVVLKNSHAGIAQYKLVKKGAAGYGVFYGEK